jgi:CRP-like cAMP-binding protein
MTRISGEARPSARTALARTPLFAGVGETTRGMVAAQSRVVVHAAGATVVAEGAPADAVFAVAHGRLKISQGHADGTSTTLAVLGPGDICGELGVLGAVARSAHITALEQAVTVRIPGPCFLAALETSPALGLALSRMLANRVRMLGEHFRQITSLEATARMAHKLLFLAERFGKADGRGIVVDLPLTQQDLAELCDLSRQRANKILRALVEEGVVERIGRRTLVRDIEALRRWSGEVSR